MTYPWRSDPNMTYIVKFRDFPTFLSADGHMTEDQDKAYRFPTRELAHCGGEGFNMFDGVQSLDCIYMIEEVPKVSDFEVTLVHFQNLRTELFKRHEEVLEWCENIHHSIDTFMKNGDRQSANEALDSLAVAWAQAQGIFKSIETLNYYLDTIWEGK
jgi:hypothetical protein